MNRKGSPFFHQPSFSATSYTFVECIVKFGSSVSVVMRDTLADTPTSPGGMRFAAQTAPISVAPGPKISNCHTSFASPTVRHSPLSP